MKESNDLMTGIDKDFHQSAAFKAYLEPYTRLYHEADVKGVEVSEVADRLIIVAND